MDLRTRERNKAIAFQEIKDALAEQVGDDANVVFEVKRITQVNTLVSVGLVVQSKGRQHTQLDPGGIAILLNRSDDFDRTFGSLSGVVGLDNFTEGALPQ